MKRLSYILLVLVLLVLFVAVFVFINQDKLVDRFIARQTASAQFRTELLEKDDKIRLVTVGTGSPIPGERAMSCNAVFVNGKFFIFDIGDGTARAIEQLRLPMADLEAIFITHWHADHYMDLPEIVNRTWLRGRQNQLTIYGPEPIDTIVKGINYFLDIENSFRLAHHGPSIVDTSIAKPIAQRIEIPNGTSRLIYESDGIAITAFLVNHEPISPAFGYRIDYKGKSLVISGDTKLTDTLIENAKDADILLHEALAFDMIERAEAIQLEMGITRNAQILNDIRNYHSSPSDAAKVAQAANVKKLILTHLGPAPENPISRTYYISGLNDIYDGPILLAEDGDIYVISIN